MTNTSTIWQQPAHTTYRLSSPSCLARATQKSLTLHESCLKFSGEKSGEWTTSKKVTKLKEKKTKSEIVTVKVC